MLSYELATMIGVGFEPATPIVPLTVSKLIGDAKREATHSSEESSSVE